jgi:hypothetical protein
MATAMAKAAHSRAQSRLDVSAGECFGPSGGTYAPPMRTLLAPALTLALLAGLTACSSTAPAAKPAAPTHSATPGAPITGVALDRIQAWGECQQLVIKKLRPTNDAPIKWSGQAQSGSAAHMTAVGHAATGSLQYRYSCAFAFDGKGNVTSESLQILPA